LPCRSHEPDLLSAWSEATVQSVLPPLPLPRIKGGIRTGELVAVFFKRAHDSEDDCGQLKNINY